MLRGPQQRSAICESLRHPYSRLHSRPMNKRNRNLNMLWFMVNMTLAPGHSMKIINTYKSGSRHSFRPSGEEKGKKRATVSYTPPCKHENDKRSLPQPVLHSAGGLRLRCVSLPTMHTVGKRRSLLNITVGQIFNAGDLDITSRANKGNCPGR